MMRQDLKKMNKRHSIKNILTASFAAGIFALAALNDASSIKANAISDNSAVYSSMMGIADVTAGRGVTEAMKNVTTRGVADPGTGLNVDMSATLNTGADAAIPGETTIEVYLSENYNSDYDLYEFGFNNKYFFYSNVGNGAMTSEPVKVEVPSNIEYALEKDGKETKYKQGTDITATGSYVMKLTVTEINGMDIIHYVSYYRFRIMEPREATDPSAAEQGGESTSGNDADLTEADVLSAINADSDLTEEEMAALEEALADGSISDEELFNPDGTVNQEAIDAYVKAQLEEELGSTDDIYKTEGVNPASGIASVYDYTTGYYLNTLVSGQTFYTDIQNGGITRAEVSLRPASDLEFVIYKDGVLYESEDISLFTESGSYMIIPKSEDVLYISAYEDELPVFCFRIIGRALNDLSLYRAPEGYSVDAVYLNNAEAESALILDNGTVLLREDGDYRIAISNEDSSMEVAYALDRVRPRFKVNVQKNLAQIYYDSHDVAFTTVYRNEKPYVTNDNIIYQIKDTGTYWYYAQDSAGNISATGFVVRYGFNTGSIVAIVLIVLAIVGLVVYIRYLNRHTRVR